MTGRRRYWSRRRAWLRARWTLRPPLDCCGGMSIDRIRWSPPRSHSSEALFMIGFSMMETRHYHSAACPAVVGVKVSA